MNEQRVIKAEKMGLVDQFVALYIGRKWFDEGHWYGQIARIADWEEIPEGADVGEPTFRMSPAEAQVLMDSLWDCGLRPSEGTGSAGALSATQKHLDDMRKIVFKKLGL